jgi:hypothetical protein
MKRRYFIQAVSTSLIFSGLPIFTNDAFSVNSQETVFNSYNIDFNQYCLELLPRIERLITPVTNVDTEDLRCLFSKEDRIKVGILTTPPVFSRPWRYFEKITKNVDKVLALIHGNKYLSYPDWFEFNENIIRNAAPNPDVISLFGSENENRNEITVLTAKGGSIFKNKNEQSRTVSELLRG